MLEKRENLVTTKVGETNMNMANAWIVESVLSAVKRIFGETVRAISIEEIFKEAKNEVYLLQYIVELRIDLKRVRGEARKLKIYSTHPIRCKALYPTTINNMPMLIMISI